MKVDVIQAIPKGNIARYLDTIGDGTGDINAIGDYSLAPVDFFYSPNAGEVVLLNRVIITIEDTGSIDSGGYGNNSSPLTNGITAIIEKQGEDPLVLTAQVNIRCTADWNSLCFDGNVVDFGAGNSFYVARWSFNKDGDALLLNENDKFIIRLNDNLGAGGQSLVGHRFLVKGKKI